MNENNLTLVEMFTTFPNSEKIDSVSLKIDTYEQIVSEYPTNESTISEPTVNNETVIVKALGNVDNSDLTDAVNIIKNFYGYNCVIGNAEPITDELYIPGTTEILNAQTCLDKFNTNNKVVYIVDKRLWARGEHLRGYASVGGGFVIVRGEKSFLQETIIHEIGHTLGLGHCDDMSCIMAVNNDLEDSGTFCNKCRNQISHTFQ
jgi:hypothetical protein